MKARRFFAAWTVAVMCGCASSPTTPDANVPVDVTAVDASPDAATDAPRDAAADAPADALPDAPADSAADGAADAGTFTLTSTAFVDRGTLPAEYTCDGVGHSPPLAWSGVPAGTVEFALLMTTLARDGLKWNWVLYGIPADTRTLAMATMGVGTAGLTSDGPALAYSPPCSRGPGPMMYTFTLYALSGRPTLPMRANLVTGAVLTDAIRTLTLASASATVTYTR